MRLSLLGTLGTGAPAPERFSISLNMVGRASVLVALTQAMVDDIATDCKAYWIRPFTNINQQAVLDSIKVAFIGANGKYTADPLISSFAPVAGATGGAPYPFQIAQAVSLTSERRGPSGKGRYYVPLPTWTVRPNGLIEPVDAQAAAGSAQQFLNDINNAPGVDRPGVRVVIASTKGFNTVVTGVRVGRALDTIRSRRAQLGEGYGATLPVS